MTQPADTAASMRAELVALLRDHPGAVLLREPANWKDTLTIVEAHLNSRRRDKDFRIGLIQALDRFLPAGVFVEDHDLLRLVGQLVNHCTTPSED